MKIDIYLASTLTYYQSGDYCSAILHPRRYPAVYSTPEARGERIELESSVTVLNDTLEGVISGLSECLTWQWDDRFDCVLATFEIADQDRVSAVMNTHFGHVWDSATIRKAPGSVSGAIGKFGGLGPGQILFSSDPAQATFLLGFWWPWGNGATISVRLVPYGLDSSDNEIQDVRTSLKKSYSRDLEN